VEVVRAESLQVQLAQVNASHRVYTQGKSSVESVAKQAITEWRARDEHLLHRVEAFASALLWSSQAGVQVEPSDDWFLRLYKAACPARQ
jgi:hypothetical protein